MKFKVAVLALLTAIILGLGVVAGLLVTSDRDGGSVQEVQAAEATQSTDISAKDQCRLLLDDFYQKLNEIDARSRAGIPFKGMRSRVGDALSAEDDLGETGGQCYTDLIKPMHEVVQLYQEGANIWAECRTCMNSVNEKFQKATDRLVKLRAVWNAWGESFR